MDSFGFAVWPPDVRVTCAECFVSAFCGLLHWPTAGRSTPCAWVGPRLNQQGAAHGWWKVHEPRLWSLALADGRSIHAMGMGRASAESAGHVALEVDPCHTHR